MKIRMIEKNEGHWIYRLLEDFGYSTRSNSTDKKLIATKGKDTGVSAPPGITLAVTFYWETEGLCAEVFARRNVNVGDANIPDIFYTFIGKDMSNGVDEGTARDMLEDLDEAAALYVKALRVANGQQG